MGRFPLVDTAPAPERAVLMGIDRRDAPWPLERSLDELERLAETAGATTVARLTQRLDHAVPRTYIGSGKVEELVSLVKRVDADVVIFDDDLTPSQQANLERALGTSTKVIDRTALILDIFGMRAQTREGRLQVQLAQLQYLLSRLRGMWSHLAKEQTRGGIGSRFGQGETQLEVDRRMIRKRISVLRREIAQVALRRDVQSRQRISSPAFRIALAGYTNAGKSSLLNALTGASVLAQDKLFATLDPTTRSLELPGGRAVTVTDTVGFIQKLPHGLVDSFKSTLAEVRDADLILKIVDASDEDADRHLKAVEDVLTEIGAGERRALTVYNKVDLLEGTDCERLQARNPEAVLVSACEGLGIAALNRALAHEAELGDVLLSVAIPYGRSELAAQVRQQGRVLSEDYRPEATAMVCKVPARMAAQLEAYRVDA